MSSRRASRRVTIVEEGGLGRAITVEFKCRECGSERIAPNVKLTETGGGGLLGRLRARVCADCGYTELRTDDALGLYLAHMRRVEGAGQPLAANIQCPSCGSVMPAGETTCEVCGWSPDAPAT